MTARVGFCCKYLHPDQSQKPKLLEEIQRPLTEKCTTVAWLNRQTVNEAEQRLYDIMQHNMQSCLLYTSPSPRDRQKSRMPSSA